MNAISANDHQNSGSAPANSESAAPAQLRDAHRPFDYGVSYGNRSGYSSGRRYAELPDRGLFHCG